ncbi:hypothetical protein GCM10009118_24380 [Wandonia haliotis]|uniref:Uncharacterized protein n=1 Tax=Wandonia haliotis TaxID=574963 RepID=A0ABN1MRQ3_9FLAO
MNQCWSQNSSILTEFDEFYHKVYVNRQLWKSQHYLSIYGDRFIELDSNLYHKIYPNNDEYETIVFKKIDSISSLYDFDFYEFYFKERCSSINDKEFNHEMKQLHEDFDKTEDYIPCTCCLRLGGTTSSGKHPKIPDCEYKLGLIGFAKDYTNTTRIYFISGSCIFLDDFETVFFDKYGITDSTVEFMIKLLFWRTNLYESDDRIIELKKIRSKKWKLLLKDEITEKSVKLNKKRRNLKIN